MLSIGLVLQEQLSGSQTHKWVLKDYSGPSYKIIKTDELMKRDM